ncbi:hypothetical protein [Saccharopolyspora taberi]|uniref:Uncharacterized protein n=1 Tax=Saccharopolyspora taberi TaxID=60895 RepID=A0ABN3V1A6_9PSEU
MNVVDANLPDGAIVIGYVASIKYIDPEDGEVTLMNTRSADLSRWEAVGMLISASDDFRARMQEVEDE